MRTILTLLVVHLRLRAMDDMSSQFMNSFKSIGGNLMQDLMKVETYKKVFKGAIKEDLSKECLEISLQEVRNLGIFQDSDSSRFL